MQHPHLLGVWLKNLLTSFRGCYCASESLQGACGSFEVPTAVVLKRDQQQQLLTQVDEQIGHADLGTSERRCM